MFARRSFIAGAGLASLGLPARAQTPDYTIDRAKGIDEGAFLKIAGTEQWVRIRGQDRSNPVLLYLHGGPGVGLSVNWPLFAQQGWERPFTVVTWDQPGSARTFARNGKVIPPTLTMDRIASDGVLVAEAAARRLGQRKVILVGGSWGSHIGVRMVKRRPDLFHAYVGTGQTVRTRDGEPLAYQRVLAKARALGNQTAVSELEAAGPPPYPSLSQFLVQRKWANAFERPAATAMPQAPGLSQEELADQRAGFIASDTFFRGADMKGPIADIDLYAMGRDFRLPVFVFQGDDDFVTPTGLVEPWFKWIRAPRKELVLIEGGGHNIAFRDGRFLNLLVSRVRPIAA